MASITLRSLTGGAGSTTKNEILSIAEVDTNFDNLNVYKVEQTGSTGSAKLPSGTTAQRDGSPQVGYTRFNTETNAAEVWTGTDWGTLGGGGITYVYKTANYTAQKSEGVIANTTGGTFTVTLPATPAAGDNVIIADGGDFSTTNLTVARNGSTIEGLAENLILDIGGTSVEFVYSGTTWQVYAKIGGYEGTVVTTTASQTLTNKTLTSPTISNPQFTGGIKETTYVASIGSTYTIATTNGTIQVLTLTANVTFSDGLTNGESVTLMISDSTAFVVTAWPTITWLGGVAPTLSLTNLTVVEVWKVGTTLYGVFVGYTGTA